MKTIVLWALIAASALPVYSQLRGPGAPSAQTPIPSCYGNHSYTDSNTGDLYIAYGFPCAWKIVSGGGGSSFPSTTGLLKNTSTTTAVTATSADITSTLGFVPLNPANNLSDVASAPSTLSNLGGVKKAGDTMTGALTLPDTIGKGPRVDVRFFGADPTGTNDSTAAINSAIAYILTQGSSTGYPVLYFPRGRYLTTGIRLTARISIMGDGENASTVVGTSPTSNVVTYYQSGAQGNSNIGTISIRDLTISGQGHTTAGTLLEIDDTPIGTIDRVGLTNSGGRGLSMLGSTERWTSHNLEVDSVRWPIVMAGATNENYFYGTHVMYPGADASGYCMTSAATCVNGAFPASGAIGADPHMAVWLAGENVKFEEGSIKSLAFMGGVRVPPSGDNEVSHIYFEGFPQNGQPRFNTALFIGGKQEISHTTGALTTTATTIPIDDAQWQPLYMNSVADAQAEGSVYNYNIYPSDYVNGSTAASTAVSGITKGTFETVSVRASSSDGNMYIQGRALNGTTAVAWPVGSVIERALGPGSPGVVKVEQNSFDAVNTSGMNTTSYSSSCSDTPLTGTGWASTPSVMCSEIFLGYVADGFSVPFPGTGNPAGLNFNPQSEASFDANSYFSGAGETDGQGFIKIGYNGSAYLDEGTMPQGSLLTGYQYGSAGLTVKMIQSAGINPFGTVYDKALGNYYDNFGNVSAVISMFQQGHSYFSRQYANNYCFADSPTNSTQSQTRFCFNGAPNSTNVQYQNWSGSAWNTVYNLDNYGNETINGSLSLNSTTSPLTLNGSAGTAGQCLQSAGPGATPTYGPCTIPDVVVSIPALTVPAGQCWGAAANTTATTFTMAGLTTSMGVEARNTGDPSSINGYGAVGGLVIKTWPSAAGQGSYKVCNPNSASISGAAISVVMVAQ